MYCPRCRAEYRDGFTECSDCHLDLVPALGPETPHRELDAVVVFKSSDSCTVGLAKGALEDAGIPFSMQSDETAARLLLIGPIMFPPCRFLVTKDREAEARTVLEPLQSPPGEVHVSA